MNALFAVNRNKDIILINEGAKKIFGIKVSLLNKNLLYLTGNTEILKLIDDCFLSHKETSKEIQKDGIFLVTVKCLSRYWTEENPGDIVVVTMSDMTLVRGNQIQREEFFANAGHELKTPLTAIKGFTELIEANNKSDKLTPYIEQIKKQTDIMLKLIGDMLSLTEISGRKKPEYQNIDVGKTIKEVLSALETEIKENKIKTEVTGGLTLKAEPKDIYELVKNLLENAVRYNVTGGEIKVVLSKEKKGAVITVKDTGIGISPADQKRLFERYYRVEKSRNRNLGGTGLGLAIVKHICQLYNAEINLESRPGLGTAVSVKFPPN